MKKIFITMILMFMLTAISFAKVEKSYYANGRLKEYHEEAEDGTLDGLQVWYEDDGQVETKGKYVNGDQEGLWVYYYPYNGQVERKGNYVDGYSEGLWKSYYYNGQLKDIGKYVKGEEVGLWKYYYDNGQLDHEEDYGNASTE